MVLTDAVPLVVAAITVIGSIVQARRKRPLTREIVKQDVELLGLLPEDSDARRVLGAHVDATVRRIVEEEDQRTRDHAGTCLAIAFLLIALLLSAVSVSRGGVWWWLTAPAALVGLLGAVGLGQDAVPRRRDAHGRPL
ncbi:hypothetical protein [Streptomyces sp. NPDC051684]|uniref:hypothetical protein n=1 Tax=Streptomyces sp. NPDC051684 TaxID=3365670 RepID=UPI0037A8A0C8